MKNFSDSKPTRLKSLDALRGFDMLWIIGGAKLSIELAAVTGWPFLRWWAAQMQHVEWHGFNLYDFIFPLFIFISGISFPFSLVKHSQISNSRSALYFRIIKRGLLLVLLGIFYMNQGIRFDFNNMEFYSVLGRIGLSWMFAALIFMNTRLNYRIGIFWGLLIIYWLLFLIFPAHDLGSTDPFSREGNLMHYIDRILMPREHLYTVYNISIITSTCTALMGMLTGQFIQSEYLKEKPYRKVLYMILTSVAFMILGKVWDLVFPINKILWSSSYVCWTGGLSLFLFAIFYIVIDVWNYTRWTTFFVVIGMNSITIYLALKFINFKFSANFLFGGFINLFPEIYAPALNAAAYLTLAWLFLYWLYKRKIFFKL
jgi:predicted acyltransferase